MADVPCGGCNLCCRKTVVVLVPPEDPADYEVEEVKPGTFMLKHKPNGDCIYLGESGCTIHERAPLICKEYDCRAQYRMYSREQRRELERKGMLDPAVLKRGRELVMVRRK